MPKKHSFFTTSNDDGCSDVFDLDKISQQERLSDIDISLVTKSITSETSFPNLSKEAEQLRRERSVAADSLINRTSWRESEDFTSSIPSKYLRYHSEDSTMNSSSFFNTESTINESDFLNSRISISSNLNKFSVGKDVHSKSSEGSSFKERSEDLSILLPERPISSIDVSHDESMDVKDVSLSVSMINKLITTREIDWLMDYFTNYKKSPTPKSAKSPSFWDIGEEKDSKCPSPDLNNKTGEKENRYATNLKENVYRNNYLKIEKPYSVTPQSSSTYLHHLPKGKLPIGTTKSEIIWGCIKPGETSSQEFLIKNRSSNPIRFMCNISNPLFRFKREGFQRTSSLEVILQPSEKRSLTVDFAPISEGAVNGLIDFSSLNGDFQIKNQFIILLGYGGYGEIQLNNVFKDTAGKSVLSLGTILEDGIMKKSFTIKNIGSLPAFAYMEFVIMSPPSVSNQNLVLLPNEETRVEVICKLKSEDLQYIRSKRNNSSVINVGKVTLIHGTEVNRVHLRRLCVKAKENGLAVKPSMEELIRKFPGEIIFNEIEHLKEVSASKEEIMRLFRNEEIIVIINQDQFPDETVSFVSLCE